MAKNKKNNVKREAYAKKQEQQGKNIILWIIGVLVLLAIVYVAWVGFMMG